jgi:hypothetical protein
MKKESKIVKAFRYLCLSFVVIVGLVAIIGTGGGGGGGGGGSTPLADGTFEKYFAPDSSFGSQTGPFNTGAYRHYMHIYHASDIKGSGYIESIAFRLNDVLGADVTCPNTTIRLGHTSRTEFDGVDNNFASYVEEGKGSLVTLVDDTTVTISAGSNGDYYILTLDSPFYYNGVDNLVVDVERTTACTGDVRNRLENSLAYRGQLATGTVGPTGTAASSAQQIQLMFEGGVNPVEFAPLPGSSNSYPFGGSGKVQLLYDATVINGSGPITGIAMRTGFAVTTDQSYTYTMRVGHSTLTDLTTDFNGNFSGTPVTVADNLVFNVPAGIPVGDYIWIPMPNRSFNYNGSDNLIVEIDVSASTGTTWWGKDDGLNMTRAHGVSGSVTAAGVDGPQYHISFRFNGGTMDVITAEDQSWGVPFVASVDHKTQIMFGAQQLGTGGRVTGISFRLAADSVFSDYPAATVVLGHTANTVLSTTFADNMTDPRTVFSGTLNVPAGLKAGDWVTTTVSGFTYDPTQNLVVEVTQDAGTADNRILATNVDVPGASGVVTGPRVGLTSTSGTPGQSDIRVHLRK